MAAYVQAMFAAIVRQHQALTSRVSAHPEPDRANLAGGAEPAIRRGLLTDNPASRAELPRARRPQAVWTSGRKTAA
jgi:hypothetical protein